MDDEVASRSGRVLPVGTGGRVVWLGAMFLLVSVAALGLGAAYREPGLIAIPQFVEVIDDLGISERLALTLSFVVPIASALALGVVVYWRRRHDGMALLFPLGFLGLFVFGSGSAGAVRASLPELAPIATAAEVVALHALALLLYLFPNGRLQPRWTAFILFPGILAVTIFPSIATAVRLAVSAPETVPPGMLAVTAAVVSAILTGAVGSQYVKYRHHATETERQQMRWVWLGWAIMVVPATLMMVGVRVLPARWTGWVILGAAVSGPVAPLTAGIAIFRYRLYDVDLVINRTIVYLTLTGFLGAVYAGSVMSLSLVRGGDNDFIVAASTLAVAALFLPARRKIQRFVDARFHRSRYDVSTTLEAFATRLRRQVDLQSLQFDLTATVQRSLEPRLVSLWLAATRSEASREAGPPSTEAPSRPA